MKNIRNTDLNALFIYVSPPSYEILEQRLRGRQTENEAAIQKRLNEAKESMEFSKEPGMYDHVILNDSLEVAYQKIKETIRQVKENLFFEIVLFYFCFSRILTVFWNNKKRTNKFALVCVFGHEQKIISLISSFLFFFVLDV